MVFIFKFILKEHILEKYDLIFNERKKSYLDMTYNRVIDQ